MAKDKKMDLLADEFEPIEFKPVETPKKVNVDKFIERKLKVINEWPDGAKKRAAVERLFRNKEAKL